MAAPKGHPKWGGRKKGSPNTTFADIRALAQEHGPAMLERLIWLANHADSQAVQATAAQAVIDRGYGKATQPIAGHDGGRFIIRIMKPGDDDDDDRTDLGRLRAGPGNGHQPGSGR